MERDEFVAELNSAAFEYHSTGHIDPFGISPAGSWNSGVRDGSDLPGIHLAAKNATDLVYRRARVARGDRTDDGNVSVRLDHDRIEHGGVWA